MLLHNEQLKEKARQLALTQDPFMKRTANRRLSKELLNKVEGLRQFAEELYGRRGTCVQPAEEWLLDNAEFIEGEVLNLKEELPRSVVKRLPYISKEGQLRAYALCNDYLQHVDGQLGEDSFRTYMQAYQDVSVLTNAEAQSLPVMLRIAIVMRLSEIMETVRERRGVCEKVEKLLAGMRVSELTPDKLKQALEEAGQELPLSGAMIVHLVQHLREHAEETANIGEWLVCKLENGPESIDAIMSYEYRLQADYQVTTGNLIGSLRLLGRWAWPGLFEQISMIERTLSKEQTGDYVRLDASSRDLLRLRIAQLAGRLKVPEKLVASQAVALADKAYGLGKAPIASLRQVEKSGDYASPDVSAQLAKRTLPPREAFVAFYVLEADGMAQLRQALKMCGKTASLPEVGLLRRASGTYFQMLAAGFAVFMLLFAWWVGWPLTGTGTAATLLLLALPASEWAVAALHWFIERTRRPNRLLRYDFSGGIPEDAGTIVVIPVIWSGPDEVKPSMDRLELHYLANRDKRLQFAVLSDYKDGHEERMPEDEEVVRAAKREINRLNKQYPGNVFHWFHRGRKRNDAEGTWMGWERKRGKLVEFVELLKGRADTSFSDLASDRNAWSRLNYIITLDADTQLPLESAHRMIGAIHLPYNRPRLNAAGTRVEEGYGVLQPRIGMSLASVQRSRLASLWASEPGVDPYAFAVSDPYQDALGVGIFTGKGIFDIDVFHRILCERIPDNRVLSHDLLEGGVLRAGLLSDIELIDDHPATYVAHQRRLHRWVRGDWQLLLWLLPRARNRRGELLPVDLTRLTRWQIIDNLRRSLLAPSLVAVVVAAAWLPGLSGQSGVSLRWLALAAATLLLPLWRQLLAIPYTLKHPRSALIVLGQVGIAFLTLPYQTAVLLHAITKSLYRLLVSKRQLLEWTSQAEVEREAGRQSSRKILGLYGGYALSLAVLAAGLLGEYAPLQAAAVIIALVWFFAPWTIGLLDRSPYKTEDAFTSEEREELQRLSREIWHFYERYVTEDDQFLPPDNVQFEPDNGIAHRTSPTNIGLYLSCVVAARDFGFIDTKGMVERLERTVATVERLEKWEGHLYNWYDTQTLAPLQPVYVSTVDSGNLAACLIAAREGLAEWLQAPDQQSGYAEPMDRGQRKKSRYEAAFAAELAGGLREAGHSAERVNGGVARPEGKGKAAGRPDEHRGWSSRGRSLLERIDALVSATDFRPLYDHTAKLFALGYQVTQQQRETVLYDLMASEARQASYVAIALGQISVSHWNALGRTLVKPDKRTALLSWSGTMFEYLMPWLFMRNYRHTLWDSTYRAVVDRQIAYAKQRGVPFGISESGYYAFDYRLNYQYRAFGVPGLGFQRGLEDDLVLAPYATIMALPFAGRRSLEALREMERLGGRGEYGYYEAIDFTRKRMPAGRRHAVIRSFMAHHQGMSMLTLSNLLLPRTMVDRFHDNKQMQAAELLLQERNPANPKWLRHPALRRNHQQSERTTQEFGEPRSWTDPHTRLPEVCVLSNGRLTSVLTNSGSGFTRFEGLSVSRWREDPVKDGWGSYVYLRDIGSGQVWAPSYQPCRTEPEEQNVEFHLDHAVFSRVEAGIATAMEVCVSPERNAEVRRIRLTNRGAEERVIEVTTFVELALASSIADDAHPAFSKLFIRTQYDQDTGCLVAGRRPREAKDRTLWAAHQLYVEGQTLGPPEFETDRAAFIGRGSTLAAPHGLSTRLHGQTGSVADPAFVMRRRVKLAPGDTVQLFAITSVGAAREEAVETTAYFAAAHTVERTFQLAWNRSRIELRHLQLGQREANAYQQLAGQVLYTPPLREERARSIAANGAGQSSLWAFGISGDRPIVLVQIGDRSHLPFILGLLTGHEYIRRLGLAFDLVILNESAGGYQQHLQESLQRAVEHGVDRFGAGSAGVHVIAGNQLAGESLNLLQAAARVRLKAGGASLAAQLRLPKSERALTLPKELPLKPNEAGRKETMHAAAASPHMHQLLFYNGWGGFTEDGSEYRLLLRGNRHLPAPWINVMANKRFGAIVSELGRGYTWWRNSRECKLTPWSNDPVLDPPGEIGFVRDEETGISWGLAPSGEQEEIVYEVAHGFGYSRFEHERSGISHQLTMFVPLEEPVKIVRIQLANRSEESRNVSVTYYAEWVIGVMRHANASYIVTDWNDEAELMTASNRYQETFREATAFLGMYAAQEDDERGLSWTGDQEEFIGRGGSAEEPAALKREKLSGRTGACFASCGAIQRKLALAPGEERTVIILLGCAASEQEAIALSQRYRTSDACDEALEEVRAFWKRTLLQTVVTTPSAEMNVMLGGWLLYQSLACRMWARTAFYQAGGAYGYRDQLQDSLALLHTMPEATRAQILIHAAHQYEEGDVQHWWHVETERGIRTLFSDDLLWLPYTVSRYIEQTADLTVLEEQVSYITSAPLKEGEHERYEETVRSQTKASVYEHCLRAIDRALSRIGEHGLPLIGVGDWNDGMNLVGDEGRGESVWLGWFLCEVLRRFEKLCVQQGDEERAEHFRRTRERLAAATNEHGWDGQWYRRAFTDSGTWLGSIHNGECRIDAIAQSWSVISGAAPKDRALQAMQSFDRELVDRELSVVRLLTPPFDETEPSPGYIQGYPPGIRENGAQYTHGVLWSIMAWSQLGQGDKAYELFHMLNPINHTRTEQEVKRYVGEPYAMAADVYTAEPHPGHAGWTWYTGASSWMYQVGLEWILGIRRQGSSLYINPCIPNSWPGYSAQYRFGESVYAIAVSRHSPADSSSVIVRLDGEMLEGGSHEQDAAVPGIPLLDDGHSHAVDVLLPARQ